MSTVSKQRVATVKVGVLTLVGLSVLVFALIWLRGHGLSGGKTFTVRFRDVNGLREGAAVQMMGIRIGFVNQVSPVRLPDGRYRVWVRFMVNKDLPVSIPHGSRLSIEQSGLIGEQFLEIAPPPLREVTLTTFKAPARPIPNRLPVKFLYEQGYLKVGEVENVRHYQEGNLVRHRLFYRITRPGAEMPENPLCELTLDAKGRYYLRILPKEPLILQAPEDDLEFTVENPMRLKRFLEIQMDSAEALKLTNDKINQLLSDETIESLHSTVKNTEVLTAKANETMENANILFRMTRADLHRLVGSSERLMTDMSSVSANINAIIGDPKLKHEMSETVSSLRESSEALERLLQDPALKETITLTRDTSRQAADLVATLNRTAKDQNIQYRMEHIVNQLDTSLIKLNEVLTHVDELTDDRDQSMKGILEDTRATARNLRQLTGRLNGRFTLFRLLF